MPYYDKYVGVDTSPAYNQSYEDDPAVTWPTPWGQIRCDHHAINRANGGKPEGVIPFMRKPYPSDWDLQWNNDQFDGSIMPAQRVLTLESMVDKRQTPDYWSRLAKGEIILNPITSVKADLVVQDGFDTNNRFVADRYLAAAAPSSLFKISPVKIGINNSKYRTLDAVDMYAFDDVYIQRTSTPRGVRFARLFKRYMVDDNPTTPPINIGREFYRQIRDHMLNTPARKGVMTALVAEANSGSFDLLTELGESRETIGYLFGLLRSVVDLIADFGLAVARIKKQPGKAAAVIATEVASLWMQFRYAVMPIAYSIDDALVTLTSRFTEYQTYRQAEDEVLELPEINGWACEPVKIINRGYLKDRFLSDHRTRGLKLNLMATAWELVPLSFVVDWVLNVGDTLSALVQPKNIGQRAAQFSSQIPLGTSVRISHPDHTGWMDLNIGIYHARPVNPYGHIGLNFSANMSWKRWLDAVSLSWLMSKDKLTKRG